VKTDGTAAGRTAARESGNELTTVVDKLITMDNKAFNSDNGQNGSRKNSSKRRGN